MSNGGVPVPRRNSTIGTPRVGHRYTTDGHRYTTDTHGLTSDQSYHGGPALTVSGGQGSHRGHQSSGNDQKGPMYGGVQQCTAGVQSVSTPGRYAAVQSITSGNDQYRTTAYRSQQCTKGNSHGGPQSLYEGQQPRWTTESVRRDSCRWSTESVRRDGCRWSTVYQRQQCTEGCTMYQRQQCTEVYGRWPQCTD